MYINQNVNSRNPPARRWLTEDTLEEYAISKVPDDLKAIVADALPAVAAKAEKLMASLDDYYSIVVHTAYLTTDHNGIFHIFMSVTETDYHSPKFQTARMLAEKYSQVTAEYAIHITFLIGDGEGIALLSGDRFKLKYVNFVLGNN